MSTNRSKRWNGELSSLTPDFLKEVIEKMNSYGDRIQFEMPTKARTPSYQVINARDMKMGFDNRHLLMRLNDAGNVGDEMSTAYTLEAIKAALANDGRKTASRGSARSTSPSSRGSSPRASSSRSTAPAAPVDTIEQDKYAYFKANREYLPDEITKHSQEISKLMREGMSAEQAFEATIKAHF
ncbi:hypothetical protein [Pollutimonas harenae]|uniref:Uncharacterized protein n=1 Tax=Pollutimonas harenae TaxID=657015 RepID=A0A853GTN6_9BURK|nr:hypothetical protein [Pollutimonas harenae]NYT85601.1 hypothetical protein [Pollutimonas harenae]TEA70682.1 hypothetical protein ERD84_08370 [Pollutimonas harenae]